MGFLGYVAIGLAVAGFTVATAEKERWDRYTAFAAIVVALFWPIWLLYVGWGTAGELIQRSNRRAGR